MQKLIKLLMLTTVFVWLFVACQSAEQEVEIVAATEPPVEVATEPPAPTEVVVEEVQPTDTAVDVVEESAEAEVAAVEEPDPVPEQAAREPVNLGGYTNVVYTELDAGLIGHTGKPQLLNVFAHW